ncbi:hypothetical protein H5410_024030 [Solanum commersonii]|uniref:Reverse transcriptase zinc-binding domain-containing protein n=1 Tax=Solanum commersonii TaxID=4109 RepID=A0A9J5ZKT2_SOLCO|nr:hypothetical protein H5410_024030 [Solanum commersonii]
METLFPNIHNLVLQQQSTIADLWTSQGWNFVFRRHLNDWEIPRVTEIFRSIDQFSGLEMGRDRLQWLGNSKGIFKVGAVYKKLNHPNLQLLKWPWKHIWKAKIPYKLWNLFLRRKSISWSMPGRISEALFSWEEVGTQAKNRKRNKRCFDGESTALGILKTRCTENLFSWTNLHPAVNAEQLQDFTNSLALA